MTRSLWTWLTRLARGLSRRAGKLNRHRSRPVVELLETRELLSGVAPTYVLMPHSGATPFGSTGPTGLTPTQIRQAYGFNQIAFAGGVTGDGSGTTIAIVDAYDDPNIASDLHQFDLQFSLPDPTFTKVNQLGGATMPAANGGWASEIALDVEWAHAIAPRANILLVEASDNSYTNLMTAASYAARQPGVVTVSMSWGGGEFSTEAIFDSVFTTPAGHSGVTFVASSGDAGAPASYPAASPNVLAVGGTTLNVNGAGTMLSETAWSGSGGGISAYENKPGYQAGVTQSSTRRTNPDVAYDSDPYTGVPVYDSFNNGGAAPWSQFGGTSAAAPQWAALVAIADQGRALAGLGSMDGATQTLPMIYGLSASDFHDVTAGTSTGSPSYSAGVGYDLTTGRGSPVANRVVADLVGQSDAPPASATHFSVTATSSSSVSGTAFNVTVTALDANNNPLPSYRGTVHFVSSDGAAILPADYTFTAADFGSHTFSVILRTTGSDSITVSDTNWVGVNGTLVETVTPAALSILGPAGQVGASAGYDMPTFAWTSASGADHYNLKVTDNRTGAIALTVANLHTTAYTTTAAQALTPGHAYTITVTALSADNQAQVQASQSFTLAALQVPGNLSPRGVIAASRGFDTPTFTWTASAGANHYYLVVIDNTTGAVAISVPSVTGTSYTTPPAQGLTPGHSFTTYVISYSTNNQVNAFTSQTFALAALAAPSSVTPGGLIADGPGFDMPTFTWSTVAGADHYYLVIVDNTNPSASVAVPNIAGTSYTLTASQALTPGHTFTTYACAVSANNQVYAISTQPFSLASLAAPTGITPGGVIASAAGYDRPTFSWNSVTAADHYYLVVVDNTAMQAPLVVPNISGTSYATTAAQALTPGHTFTAYVCAVSANCQVYAIGTQTFALSALSAPAPTAPIGPIAASPAVFTWSQVVGADHYYVYVLDDTTGAVVINNASVAGTSFSPTTPLASGHKYTWWVAAVSTNAQVLLFNDGQDFTIA